MVDKLTVGLKVVPASIQAPVPSVVEALEWYLAMARSGELRAFAAVGFLAPANDGRKHSFYGGDTNLTRMLGGVNYLAHRIALDLHDAPDVDRPEPGPPVSP